MSDADKAAPGLSYLLLSLLVHCLSSTQFQFV